MYATLHFLFRTKQRERYCMAATGEQRGLKITFVSLAINPHTVSQISAETEATQTLIAVEL